MKLLEHRKEAAAALVRLRRREREWMLQTRTLRFYAARHRSALIVGGGFVAGLALSLLPLARIVRVASALVGTASFLVSGPLAKMLVTDAFRSGATPGPPV